MKVNELYAVMCGRIWFEYRDRWTNAVINPHELAGEERAKFWYRDVYKVFPGEWDKNSVKLNVWVD